MPTLYETAKNFDKSYDTFRTDVSSTVDGIVFMLAFRRLAAPFTVRKGATTLIQQGLSHQVRPFGTTKIVEDAILEDIEIRFAFKNKAITDVSLRSLLERLIALAKQISTQYNFDP